MIEGADRRLPLFNPFNLGHGVGQASLDDWPRMLSGERLFLKEDRVLCGQCVALCPAMPLRWTRGNCVLHVPTSVL